MEPSDISKGTEGLTDAMYRKIKNRERQRRYRERKRLRADPSNAHVSNSPAYDPSLLQIVPFTLNGMTEQVVTRVHCTRDWKKDARRIHIVPKQANSNAFSSYGQSLIGENRHMNFPLGTQEAEQTSKSEVPLKNSDKPRNTFGRRAWKAEARSKK